MPVQSQTAPSRASTAKTSLDLGSVTGRRRAARRAKGLLNLTFRRAVALPLFAAMALLPGCLNQKDRLKCTLGDPHVCSNLSVDHKQGHGAPRDERKAAALHRNARAGGETSACSNLGVDHKQDHGAPRDERKAAAYRKACTGGDLRGCLSLFRASMPKADTLQQCNSGDLRACFYLGEDYEYGRSVTRDRQRANALYQKACNGGVAGACFKLGLDDMLRDPQKADILLRKACDGGDMNGCIALAVAYDQGHGVPQDERKAAALYQKACDGRGAGIGACCRLGVDYDQGQGVPHDERKAAALCEKACNYGWAKACTHGTSP